MKYKYHTIQYRNRNVMFGITLLFALFIQKWSSKTGDYDIYSILSGIEFEGKEELHLLAMGKWLFLLGFFLIITTININTYKKISILLIFRYGEFKKWWIHYFLSVINSVCICFFCTIFVWKVYGGNSNVSCWKQAQVSCHYLLHLLSIISIIIVLDLILQSNSIIAFFIIAEGVMYIFSVCYQYPWLVPGMYVRSNWHTENGYNGIITYILEFLVIILCFIIIPILWKKGHLEERNWINGKDN